MPLYRLLGGRAHDHVMTTYHVSNTDPDAGAVEAADAVSDGFRLVKIKVGVGPVERDMACAPARFAMP